MTPSPVSGGGGGGDSGRPWDARFAGPIPHTASYYGKCLAGGALACGVTHTAVVPLDVVKVLMQVPRSRSPCSAGWAVGPLGR
jgi:hypothetical protein